MVEPRLLHAALTSRRLLLFFALGALLLGAKGVLVEAPAVKQLEVRVAEGAEQREIDHAVQRAVLASFALERGALAVDPLAKTRVPDGLDPVRHAGELVRADPLLRERLAFQGEQLLHASLALRPPSEDALNDYFARHAARYRAPARVDATHILVSVRRGERERAARMREVTKAIREGLSPARARALTDPSILPRALAHLSEAEIDAAYGPGVGAAALATEVGGVSAPVTTRFGKHFVWVHEKTPARMPSLDQVRPRVRADYLADARARALRRAISSLVAGYEVALVMEPSP